jgi:hypothetical protein
MELTARKLAQVIRAAAEHDCVEKDFRKPVEEHLILLAKERRAQRSRTPEGRLLSAPARREPPAGKACVDAISDSHLCSSQLDLNRTRGRGLQVAGWIPRRRHSRQTLGP